MCALAGGQESGLTLTNARPGSQASYRYFMHPTNSSPHSATAAVASARAAQSRVSECELVWSFRISRSKGKAED